MSSVRYCLGRDFQPAAAAAAYFGELEEALIHGANAGGVVDPGMIRADVHSKCKPNFLLSFLFSLSLFLCIDVSVSLQTLSDCHTWRDMPRLLRSSTQWPATCTEREKLLLAPHKWRDADATKMET